MPSIVFACRARCAYQILDITLAAVAGLRLGYINSVRAFGKSPRRFEFRVFSDENYDRESGSKISKVVPGPGPLVCWMQPPCEATICAAMGKPKPEAPGLVVTNS